MISWFVLTLELSARLQNTWQCIRIYSNLLEDTGKPVGKFTNTVLALKESSQSILFRAVASFFVTRGHYCKCQRHKPCRGVWGILLQNILDLEALKCYFQPLSWDMSPKNWPQRGVKRHVFSVLTSAYFRGPVNLKPKVYPSTSTLNISQYCMTFG